MNTVTKYDTQYTGSLQAPYQWTTDSYELAVALAGKDAARAGRLFSEIYDKKTNMVIGYASYDGKEM